MAANTLKTLVAAFAMLGAADGAAYAGSATFSVPGTSNPFLAGASSGATCCSGDTAPGESPVTAGGVTPGSTLTFTNVTGGVSFGGGTPTDGPDGNSGLLVSTPDYEGGASFINSIAGYLNTPVDALIGVFLPAGGPLAADQPAATLDFGSSGLTTSFTTLSPDLQQIFFIGDGLTGTGTGSVQTFIVPTGASELYLGTVDGFGWNNNSGAISVTVNGLSSAVPEPSTWILALVGFAGLGVAGARASRRSVAAAT